MTRPTLNVALIGAGEIGCQHARTLAEALPGVRLAAVVDPIDERAGRAAALGDQAVVARDLDAVLGEGIDAVVIAAPAREHRSLIEAAAAARTHIFCEKPIALTMKDAASAVEAAERAGVKLQVGFQRRYDPAYVRAKEAIERGEIGAVELILSTTRDPAPPQPGAAEAAGGIYLDCAIHDFDSMRFFAGSEPTSVFAMASTLVTTDRTGPYDIDTSIAQVRFASGALGVATTSLRAAYGYDAGAEVFGSKGKIVIAVGQDAGVQTFTAAGAATTYPQTYGQRFAQAYRAELADFVRCIVDDAEPRASGREAVRSLAVGIAATRSQREGRVVAL